MQLTPRYRQSLAVAEEAVVRAIVRVEWDSRDPEGHRVGYCYDANDVLLYKVPLTEPFKADDRCHVAFYSDHWTASMDGPDRAPQVP